MIGWFLVILLALLLMFLWPRRMPVIHYGGRADPNCPHCLGAGMVDLDDKDHQCACPCTMVVE